MAGSYGDGPRASTLDGMTLPLFVLERPAPSTFTIDVYGTPAPKGSKRAILIGGEPRLIEGGSDVGQRKTKLWAHCIESTVRPFVTECIEEPVEVTLDFTFERVASEPYRNRHAVKPDIDKLARGVLDSLTNVGFWKDDALVSDLHCSARYAMHNEEPGCTITVVCRGGDEVEESAHRRAMYGRPQKR